MLYLVATPIGNLADITLRSLTTLQEVDYILCEDTRHAHTLCKHHNIDTPLKAFHKFNEVKLENSVITDLKNGLKIALISDRGTPAICDPGAKLITRCHQEEITVTSLPGASSVITALSLFGNLDQKFQFVGFLPKKPGALKKALLEMLLYPGLSIAFDSPHHLLDTLKAMPQEAQVTAFRELTKMYEERVAGTAKELLAHFTNNAPRGEFVLIIQGYTPLYEQVCKDPKKAIEELQSQFDLSSKEAVKIVAEIGHLNKKELYKSTVSLEISKER